MANGVLDQAADVEVEGLEVDLSEADLSEADESEVDESDEVDEAGAGLSAASVEVFPPFDLPSPEVVDASGDGLRA
jgi:hypothetical protein